MIARRKAGGKPDHGGDRSRDRAAPLRRSTSRLAISRLIRRTPAWKSAPLDLGLWILDEEFRMAAP